MTRFLIVIREITEFRIAIEASDEAEAREKAEEIAAEDGGPAGDYHEIDVRPLPAAEGGA